MSTPPPERKEAAAPAFSRAGCLHFHLSKSYLLLDKPTTCKNEGWTFQETGPCSNLLSITGPPVKYIG